MINIDDRMEILDLCSRYNYFVDTDCAEQWADTFTKDGTFEGPAGRAEGRDELIAFCHSLAEQFPGGRHFTDNHLFEVRDDVVLHRCFLSFQVPADSGTDVMLLGYEDEVVKVDGDWRFRTRRVGPITAPE
jgi:hypothetical protein